MSSSFQFDWNNAWFYDWNHFSSAAFGDVFSGIGVREPQPAASEAFSVFGEAHRNMEKFAIHMLKTVKPMISDLNTFLHKAVPDTRLTIKKYLDAKFEYLVSWYLEEGMGWMWDEGFRLDWSHCYSVALSLCWQQASWVWGG